MLPDHETRRLVRTMRKLEQKFVAHLPLDIQQAIRQTWLDLQQFGRDHVTNMTNWQFFVAAESRLSGWQQQVVTAMRWLLVERFGSPRFHEAATNIRFATQEFDAATN